MRKGAIAILLTLGFLIAASATVSRAQVAYTIKADIPFSFNVLSKSFPAGSYEIKRLGHQPNILVITNLDDDSRMIFEANSSQIFEPKSDCVLVFNRYGDESFLSKIYEEGSNVGVEILKSPMEKRMKRSMELASVHSVQIRAIFE